MDSVFSKLRIRLVLCVSSCIFIAFVSCKKEYFVPIPQTVEFEQSLSAYNLYQGTMSNLAPSNDTHPVELSAILFSNYAKKQRLLKIPTGTSITQNGSGIPIFPEGTILAKTFYYYLDETDTAQGKQIIETRLLILGEGKWNAATYEWNDSQTDASLKKEGLNKQVSWIDSQGDSRTIDYRLPSQTECVKCHLNSSEVTPIGPSLRNMQRIVTRNGNSVNQLAHLESIGILNSVDFSQVHSIADYNDLSNSLASRGRAYLDMNCASCHNPDGLPEAEQQKLDFRYETPLKATKILKNKNKIIEVMESGRMPDIGTTVIDEEGVQLVNDYINSL